MLFKYWHSGVNYIFSICKKNVSYISCSIENLCLLLYFKTTSKMVMVGSLFCL